MPEQSGDLVKKQLVELLLKVGKPCLGCQLCGNGLLESWKDFVVSVQLQVVGKQ